MQIIGHKDKFACEYPANKGNLSVGTQKFLLDYLPGFSFPVPADYELQEARIIQIKHDNSSAILDDNGKVIILSSVQIDEPTILIENGFLIYNGDLASYYEILAGYYYYEIAATTGTSYKSEIFRLFDTSNVSSEMYGWQFTPWIPDPADENYEIRTATCMNFNTNTIVDNSFCTVLSPNQLRREVDSQTGESSFKLIGITGTTTQSISKNIFVKRILVVAKQNNTIIKIGNSVGGNNLLFENTIATSGDNISTDISELMLIGYTIHVTVTSGEADIYITYLKL